jgi:CPA2 family monovalent cation:H+ antiporter-2
MDSLLFPISMMCLLILLLIALLKKLKQPYIVAYIIAGVLLGPYAGHLFNNADDAASVGEFGLLLLMFFLGMEIEIPNNKSLLFKPVIAQTVKMVLSGLFAFCLGRFFHLGNYSILLIAILFIFNSTAVVSEYLSKNGELDTVFGQSLLNILLLQDILLAPVLTFLQVLGKSELSVLKLLFACGFCVLIFTLLRATRNERSLKFINLKGMQSDHELQVFTGCLLCLGFALLAERSGLSASIGSFAAGMFIGRISNLRWLENVLKPFRVFFVALFFVSIGLRLDLNFIGENFQLILSGVLLVLLGNSLLSAVTFKALKYKWRQSLYGGALLSQTGEFGIVACTLAYQMELIDNNLFKAGISITALTLLFSTTWITILKKAFKVQLYS